MKLKILFLFVLLSLSTFCQNFADPKFYILDSLDLKKMDSSELVLIKSSLQCYYQASSELNKINCLNRIAQESTDDAVWPKYNQLIIVKIEALLKTKVKESDRTQALLIYANALNDQGFILNQGSGSKKALQYFFKCLPIYLELKNKEAIAYCYNNMGEAYMKNGEIILSIKYHYKSLKLSEEMNNLEGLALSYNNIGSIYDQQFDYPQAMKYYLKGMKFQKKINDKSGLATSYNNIGHVYSKFNNNREALKYYLLAEHIFRDIGEIEGLTAALSNIGSIYAIENQTEKAIRFFDESIKYDLEIENSLGTSYSYSALGKIYFRLNQLEMARNYGIKSLEIAQEIENPEIIQIASALLAQIYRRGKNWQKAFEMQSLNQEMSNLLNNTKTQKEAVKLGLKHEYDKQKFRDTKENEKKLAVSKEKEQRQKLIIYFVLGILLVVVSFLFLIVNRFKLTKKQKTIIEQQKHLVEEKNQEITDSITYAKRIQSAILPQDKLIKEHLPNSFILYKPKDIVAGDFYWFDILDDLIFFAAADCTGHGVPGALVSVVCHNALNRSLKEFSLTNPADILDKTREIVVAEFEKSDEDVKDGMDISLCVLNKKSLTLSWAGAHNPLWILRNQEIIEYKADKQPIGKFAYAKAFTNHEILLLENDEIFISTDGFQDQFGGEKGKKFKASQMKEILVSNAEKSIFEKEKTLHLAFDTWKNDFEQVDDVCMIGLKI